MNIDSIQFNKNCSVLTANPKAAAGHNKIVIAYKIDTGSDSSIMPFHAYKKLFPNVTKKQLAETRNKRITLETYNKTSITQLDMCKVTIEHKSNMKDVISL